jgi:demethylmenaquinone methyltransferase/2-methoxy-6-polyprenyl-1,4-benzoquinol methylase
MLDLAREKYAALSAGRQMAAIDFVEGEVAGMPFEDGRFDALGITFGIRNLVYENSQAPRHLSEIARVLRPGGRLIILESSRPDNVLWRIINSLYLQLILPYLGGIISGNLKAYRYLARSSKNYYSIAEMGAILEEAGFEIRKGVPFFLGSVMLVVAEKS